jgi:hypothetical protein
LPMRDVRLLLGRDLPYFVTLVAVLAAAVLA